jgi:hypothetical protein
MGDIMLTMSCKEAIQECEALLQKDKLGEAFHVLLEADCLGGDQRELIQTLGRELTQLSKANRRRSITFEEYSVGQNRLAYSLLEVISEIRENSDVEKFKLESQNRIALVIGCKNYPGEWELQNPVNDARAIGEKLRSMGFETHMLLNCAYSEMMKFISSFPKRSAGKKTVLFYFAGHGIQNDGKNYLLPIDADIRDKDALLATSVSVERLMVELSPYRKIQKILILDACRTQPAIRSATRDMTGIGLAEMKAATNCFVSFSTSPGSVASDGKGNNGLFTGALLQKMGKPGQSVADVFQEVREYVSKASLGTQVPWDTSSLESKFFFRPR